jgi:hypothetical protein
MAGARQIITVIITFRKSNKNSLQHQAGTYLSSKKKYPIFNRQQLTGNRPVVGHTRLVSF